MSRATAVDVIQEVEGLVQSIAELQGKVVFVYDPNDDLADKLKHIKLPAIGIIYEGMRSVGDNGSTQTSVKLGASAEMVFSLAIAMQPEVVFRADAKTPVILLLDSVRSTMFHKRSVTGHYYRFMVEAPAVKRAGLAVWVQRWSVPIQLSPQQNQQG